MLNPSLFKLDQWLYVQYMRMHGYVTPVVVCDSNTMCGVCVPVCKQVVSVHFGHSKLLQ